MILSAMLETRATKRTGGDPQSPAYWVRQLFGGGRGTAAGVTVTTDTALEISAFFCGVNLICNWVKSMPLIVYRRVDGQRVQATGQPAYKLLHRRPNPETTPSRFKWFLQASKLLWGNGFAEIERDGSQRPRNLWPIHPSRVELKRNGANEVVYIVRGESGANSVIVPARNMLHTWDFSLDGIWGRSVVEMATESMGLMIATDQSAAGFFGNGAQVSGAITFPHKLDPAAKENVRRTWNEVHQGSGRAHNLAIFDQGEEFKQMGMPVKDWQLLESRTFSVLEMSRWLLLPPHKLKELTRATFSNIDAQRLETVDEAVLPRAIDMEEECNLKFFPNNAEFFCKFSMNALLRGDPVARGKFYHGLLGDGVFSINDVLDLEDMNGLGPVGDKHRVNAGTVAIEDPPPEPEPAPAPPPEPDDDDDTDEDEEDEENEERSRRLAEAGRILFRDAAGRIINKEADKLKRLLRKFGHDKADFLESLGGFYDKHRVFVRQAIAPAIEAYSHARLVPVDIDSVVDSIVSTSEGQIRGLVRDTDNGDVPEAIEKRVKLWADERPDAIAERCLK